MKFLSRLLSFVLMGALFLVTAHLTTDLLTRLLPDKYWYLPSIAVAAFDGGLIVWILTLLYVVENGAQRSVSWIMIAVDFGGVGIAAIADVFLADSAKGLVAAIPPDQMRWVVVGVVSVIIVNVAAWSSMHVLAPENIGRTTGKQSARLAVPQRKVARRPSPTRVRVAQTVEAPRELPAPVEEELEEDDEVEQYDAEEEEEEEAYDDEEEDESQEAEVTPSPLSQRVAEAKNALFPPKSRKKKLPSQK